jgi:8-oxo-dGTP pyrophosphatase MutT (NUDIX family)
VRPFDKPDAIGLTGRGNPEARNESGMERDNLDRVRRAFEPVLRRVMHVYWRFARGMTLGVRALVIDDKGRVFLVKHSYVSGWHLPGGGVEAGETLVEAVARELHEEGNIDVTEPPRLHGMFFNDRDSRRDHVALFVVREFQQSAAPVPDHEIVAHGFFAVDAMPNDTTAATRARIIEVLGGAPVRERW